MVSLVTVALVTLFGILFVYFWRLILNLSFLPSTL